MLKSLQDIEYRYRVLNMVALDFLFRDPIIRASASTYNLDELARLGLKIEMNLSGNKIRFIGDPPIYPELIIWKPDYQGANTGRAVLVESIETAASINSPETIDKWRRLSTQGVTFNLIVPFSSQALVRQMLVTHVINNVTLQTHNYDQANSRYIFTTVLRR